ncbi:MULTISPECIES: hypothetical protein [unclassified Streptomyces]|uniref:hypothetical protein n=1 Tax=unclassified Streptomyces TaxID=2593676 RepID=UPI00131A3D52|nr:MULTISPECIES: hypothetical protein [unclassified Streptomyces]MYX32248.1 hypothetical protein [Streptomyces sp. SID8377]
MNMEVSRVIATIHGGSPGAWVEGPPEHLITPGLDSLDEDIRDVGEVSQCVALGVHVGLLQSGAGLSVGGLHCCVCLSMGGTCLNSSGTQGSSDSKGDPYQSATATDVRSYHFRLHTMIVPVRGCAAWA